MMKLAVHNTDSPISSIEDIIEDARNGRSTSSSCR